MKVELRVHYSFVIQYIIVNYNGNQALQANKGTWNGQRYVTQPTILYYISLSATHVTLNESDAS